MRALLQRVSRASVSVQGEVVGSIGRGLVVLLAVARGHGEEEARYVTDKVVNLRIFADEEGRFNRSALDVGADLLIISQFTLYADTRRLRWTPKFGQVAKRESRS